MTIATKAAILIAGAILAASTGATAQSSQCQWIGNVWTCNQTPRSGINWDILRPTQTPADAFQQGMEMGERARRAKLERERIQAETELYRAQAKAAAPQSSSAGQGAAPSQVDAEFMRKWYAAARPRMGLFPDFEKIVFAPEVRITPDMVMLMSNSPYAADIAYHLATHNAEAMAISRLPLLDAAKAIDGIEATIKASPRTPAKP